MDLWYLLVCSGMFWLEHTNIHQRSSGLVEGSDPGADSAKGTHRCSASMLFPRVHTSPVLRTWLDPFASRSYPR